MKTMLFLMLAAALILTTACGCDVGTARKQGAAARWEETIEQVRLEAARESLAQGRYDYARKALEPCLKSERNHQDAERLMAQIQAADQVYAQMADYRDEDNQERAY